MTGYLYMLYEYVLHIMSIIHFLFSEMTRSHWWSISDA